MNFMIRVFFSLVPPGVSILRYISISILIKYSNFSGFYKKLGPFYKKLRCDKFGNWSISTKNALNNQIQSSIKIDMYIVRNCCLPIADFETTGVHVNHVDSVVMPNQTKTNCLNTWQEIPTGKENVADISDR